MTKKPFKNLELDEKVTLVQDALAAEVMTALAMDGGGLEIMDIEGCEVSIKYYGACGNCPMARTSTLAFIQGVLQEKIDPEIIIRVVY